MSLFGEECRKMLGKKIVWFAAAVLFVFLGIYISSDINSNHVKENGIHYWGLEAIQKNREIAKEWEGTLTMERLSAILDTYGPALMETDEEGRSRSGNWVSQYATNRMTDYMQGGNGALKEEEDLKQFAALLERYRPYFTYMGGFDSILLESGMIGNIGVLLIIVIALAPVFGEEYILKTAPLLLTSVHGKNKDVRAKVFAALAIAGILYLLVNGLLFLVYLVIYGGDGLNAGSCLSMNIEWDSALTCGEIWLNNLRWGLLGSLMMAAITLFFSAKCKTPFLALICALISLFSGYLFVKVVPFLLPYRILARLCIVLGKWGPLYLQMNYSLGVLSWEMPWELIYVLGMTMLCILLGQHFYQKHEC